VNAALASTRRSGDIVLAAGEIHLWWIDVRVGVQMQQQLSGLLQQDERDRAARFYFEPDRRRFVVARAAMRSVLAGYLNVQAERISFQHGPCGKPWIAANALRFNGSHSGNWALLAVSSDQELGVDVERVDSARADRGLARRFFAPAEVTELENLPVSERVRGFFNCWTRKEAFIKATGEGLQRPLDSFQVSLGPRRTACLLQVDGKRNTRWCMWSLEAPAGYTSALVVDGGAPRALQVLRWLPDATVPAARQAS